MSKGQQVLELVSYGQFGFSRQDLDGNMPAKGKCLARKAGDKEVFTMGHRFLF